MGIKMNLASHGKRQKITVICEVLYKGKRTKTFPIEKMKEALDYALAIDSGYMDTVSDEIYDKAVELDHDILFKKNWCFV